MRFRLLGSSGLKVSELCLGTMTFGESTGIGANHDESRRMYDTYREAGGNFIDTANLYTGGESEKFLGEFIGADRTRVVLATKYSMNTDPANPNAGGNARKNLHEALHASLQRLRTDYVDLFWVHAWDGLTPLDELMRALDDAVRAGKVLYIGFSNVPAWVVSRANTMAELRGWSRFVALQLHYNLTERNVERELVPCAQALGMAITAWSPLAGGLLSGKYSANAEERKSQPGRLTETGWGNLFLNDRNLAIAAVVQRVAQRLGRPASHVALAWLASRPGNVIPVLGSRKDAQLRELLASADLQLDDVSIAELNEAGRLDRGYPGGFLDNDRSRQMVHGTRIGDLDRR